MQRQTYFSMSKNLLVALLTVAVLFSVSALAAKTAYAAEGELALTASASKKVVSAPIPAGDYYILRADAQGKAIDVSGGSSANGANVQLYDANGTKAQLWHVEYDKRGRYTFVCKRSGKALDAAGGRMANETNVQQYRENKSIAQKWYIEKVKGGYRISSAKNRSYVLDCAAGGTSNGTNIQLYRSNGTKAQRFVFVNAKPRVKSERVIPNGIYKIESKVAAGKVVDIAGGSIGNSANARIWSSNGSLAQRWMVKYGRDGYYTIQCLCSGRVLDVEGVKKTPGGNVCQYGRNDAASQKWAIAENADGTYSIVNKASGLAASVEGGKSANGTNVQTAIRTKSKSQKFLFKQASAISTGTYTLFSKLDSSGLSVGVRKGSTASGASAELQIAGSAVEQRFFITGRGNGLYSMQSVSSGLYLTDDSGGAVQRRASAKKGLSKNQLWKVGIRGGGVTLTNAGTGRMLTVAGGKAAAGASLVTRRASGAASQVFRPVKKATLIQSGNYTLYSRAGNACIDVSGGSWKDGANAQLYTPNGTNAQKFYFEYAGSGFYRISLALSGNCLTVQPSKKKGVADVRLNKSKEKDTQLWKVQLTDAGIAITNKANGYNLTFASKKPKKGSNVRVSRNASGKAQLWKLVTTDINVQDTRSMTNLVNSVPSAWGSITLDSKGRSFSISSSAMANLQGAVDYAWNRDESVGFVMIDMQTGMSVSLSCDKRMHGASTMKAAYVTYIFQELLEKGRVSLGDVRWLMQETIANSNNGIYATLRDTYGTSGYASWLNTIGLGYLAYSSYPSITARELALIWTKLYAYEESGGRYTWLWRSMFNHSYYSGVRETLSGDNWVYSKPGWVGPGGGYAALNDGAIVMRPSGRTYIVALLSNVNCYGEQWITRGIIKALDRVHAEM